jgi:hypothetical protein
LQHRARLDLDDLVGVPGRRREAERVARRSRGARRRVCVISHSPDAPLIARRTRRRRPSHVLLIASERHRCPPRECWYGRFNVVAENAGDIVTKGLVGVETYPAR